MTNFDGSMPSPSFVKAFPLCRSAAEFARQYPHEVLGWRLAGFSHAQIAEMFCQLGLPVKTQYVKQLMPSVIACANRVQAHQVADGCKSAIRRRVRHLVESGIGSAEPVPIAAQRSRRRPKAPEAVPAMPAEEESRPTEVGAEVGAEGEPSLPVDVAWGDVAGAEEDFDPLGVTDPPRSFGELRRSLWRAKKTQHASAAIFSDGQSVVIPSKLHEGIFNGSIASWKQLGSLI